ncbi:MAG: glycosyltransferase family A protein [Ferruginibacter sp.]
MTAYNRETCIAEAIESVLSSTYRNFELIIVDDCSIDNTVSIARSYEAADTRVRVVINEKNLGDYPNRNRAASIAKGEYIKYVDSDDVIFPDSLEAMTSAMEQFPEAAFGFSDPGIHQPESLPKLYTGEQALRKHFLHGGLLLAGPSTTIIKTAAFHKIGGFSGKRFISDYEAWLNFCLHFPVVVFKPKLMWLRTHEGQENDVGKLSYYSLNYNLHKQFISNPANPFSPAERKKILYNYRILLGRRVYQRLLKWYGLRKSLRTIKDSGESYLLFLRAFMPMKK